MTLSPAERQSALALLDALVPHGAGGLPDPRAAGALEAFERLVAGLPSPDRWLFRGLLRAFGVAPRLFLDGQGSRLRPRRLAAAALRSLACLAYYTRPATWPATGYDGPFLGRVAVDVLPVADEPVPTPGGRIAPGTVARGRDIDRDARVRADVVVVGTGAGGAAAAATLAEAGLDVLVLEAGPALGARDFTQREEEMLPLLFAERGLRSAGDGAIPVLQGRGLGGSTLHNTGLVWRAPPGILDRWRREHGLDAPDRELDSLFAEVEATLRATPIRQDEVNANNAAVRRGAEALGLRFRVPHHARVDCCGCGYCMIGCAYNRKQSALTTWLPRALRAGARVVAEAAAFALDPDRPRKRVLARLAGRDGRPGRRLLVAEAPIVVVAAGAIDTAALLLRSGLRGESGLVGRTLRLHPSPAVGAVFDDPVDGYRGVPHSVIVDGTAPFLETGRDGYLVLPVAAPPGLGSTLLPGAGPRHAEYMRRYRHLAAAVALVHDETCGRVRPGILDAARPRIDYWPDRHDLAAIRDAVRRIAELYLAAGAREVLLPFFGAPPVRARDGLAGLDAALAAARFEPFTLSLSSVHPQGTCPLGADRRRSVVSPVGEMHGHRGLFVADASVFPTSIGVPPQVTTMALAVRTARHIVARYGR